MDLEKGVYKGNLLLGEKGGLQYFLGNSLLFIKPGWFLGKKRITDNTEGKWLKIDYYNSGWRSYEPSELIINYYWLGPGKASNSTGLTLSENADRIQKERVYIRFFMLNTESPSFPKWEQVSYDEILDEPNIKILEDAYSKMRAEEEKDWLIERERRRERNAQLEKSRRENQEEQDACQEACNSAIAKVKRQRALSSTSVAKSVAPSVATDVAKSVAPSVATSVAKSVAKSAAKLPKVKYTSFNHSRATMIGGKRQTNKKRRSLRKTRRRRRRRQ
jgi:hypothetical protein